MPRIKKQAGFTPPFPTHEQPQSDKRISQLLSWELNRYKERAGFTLIELLVVVAVIALLSSIIMIGVMQARQKSRDAKRLSDMTQMNTALELYFAANKGYPTGTNGIPQNMSGFAITLPTSPVPADGACGAMNHSASCSANDPGCANVSANTYYYVASGSPVTINGVTVYPDYAYFFCLGNTTGNFNPGERIITPTGVK